MPNEPPSGAPGLCRVEIRVLVGVDDAENHLRDDSASGRSEPNAVLRELAFLQDVEPQRRLATPRGIREAEGLTMFCACEKLSPWSIHALWNF
jgi:hypothetical protein